jgi:hypothetical protein
MGRKSERAARGREILKNIAAAKLQIARLQKSADDFRAFLLPANRVR